MKKRKFFFHGIRNFPYWGQILAAGFMIAGGVFSAAVSHACLIPPETDDREPEVPILRIIPIQIEEKENTELEETEDNSFIPAADQFNLAFLFPDDADLENPMESSGGAVYRELSSMEAEWLGKIYNLTGMTPQKTAEKLGYARETVMGKYNPKDKKQKKDDPATWTIPSWEKVSMKIYDGNGRRLSGDSNLKEILSMASIYTFFHDYRDEEAFLQYARQLWKDSHRCAVHISNVYYCDGCIGEDEISSSENQEETAGETTNISEPVDMLQEGETVSAETDGVGETKESEAVQFFDQATPGEYSTGPGYDLERILSDTEDGDSGTDSLEEAEEETEEIRCPGHVDLYIEIQIQRLDGGKNNLFSIDQRKHVTDDSWAGWTEENMAYAKNLSSQDWQERYGLNIPDISPGIAADPDQIAEYMDRLPDDLSQTRREIIQFALNSVGKVPYYWGGKPYAKGYTGNSFGMVINPDKKGRIRRGLDCSGWISWVYWSVTGERLPAESTTGLIHCGTEVSPGDLQPGDILIRIGEEENHVVMFLGWGSNGTVTCIHESSDSVNNVWIDEKELNWDYYRKLVE